MEHLRGAGLIASAVVEEVLELLLSLDLTLEAGRSYDVVVAADEKEMAVGVLMHDVAGQIPVAAQAGLMACSRPWWLLTSIPVSVWP